MVDLLLVKSYVFQYNSLYSTVSLTPKGQAIMTKLCLFKGVGVGWGPQKTCPLGIMIPEVFMLPTQMWYFYLQQKSNPVLKATWLLCNAAEQHQQPGRLRWGTEALGIVKYFCTQWSVAALRITLLQTTDECMPPTPELGDKTSSRRWTQQQAAHPLVHTNIQRAHRAWQQWAVTPPLLNNCNIFCFNIFCKH